MSKSIVEIQGFEELERKIKQLKNDKSKNKAILSVLRQQAKSTANVAKSLAPVGNKKVKRYSGGRVVSEHAPGNLKKSIGVIALRRAKSPTVHVGARAGRRSANDGYYAHFVHDGTVKTKSKNPFLTKAFETTKGQVIDSLERGVAKVIQNQINRLSR